MKFVNILAQFHLAEEPDRLLGPEAVDAQQLYMGLFFLLVALLIVEVRSWAEEGFPIIDRQ